MSQTLPRLRMNLDFMPSPVPERPGLLIRDSFRYSDATLIIPPPLVALLEFFDGQHTELDLRQELVRMTGELSVGDIEEQILTALSGSGFLEDENYEKLRDMRHREFAEAPKREPEHAGAAYPDDPGELRQVMDTFMRGDAADSRDGQMGIAAPHVSPEGGYRCYQAAYRRMLPDYRDKTFVILGTSHYGEPERFGLTRKHFVTPYGDASVDTGLVDWLAEKAPGAVKMEDYCHAVEHSIEFQVVFLQHLYGPDIRILPILCGAFARSLYEGGMPEDDSKVERFLGSLGELAARESSRLFWVLGIDMAHMGRRYGDRMTATADRGEMLDVADRDRARIERLNAGDARGFWSLVQENGDDLKWCGSSPAYTFLRVAPEARGTLERYEQWNIDDQSIVSFAGISFSRGAK